MKPKKREVAKVAAGRRASGSARTAASALVRPLVAALAALAAVFWAYGPALQSPFWFDDTAQQFALPSASAPLSGWIGPVRPVLMVTYWVNTQIALRYPYSFHVFNVLLHCITAALIFAIVRQLVDPRDRPGQSKPTWKPLHGECPIAPQFRRWIGPQDHFAPVDLKIR